jgi:hypothetical protein
MKGKCER